MFYSNKSEKGVITYIEGTGDSYRPRYKLDRELDIVSLGLVNDNAYILDKDGNVWITRELILGKRHKEDDIITLTSLRAQNDIIQISSSGYNMIMLSSDGIIYPYKYNYDKMEPLPLRSVQPASHMVYMCLDYEAILGIDNYGIIWGSHVGWGYLSDACACLSIYCDVSNFISIGTESSTIVALDNEGKIWYAYILIPEGAYDEHDISYHICKDMGWRIIEKPDDLIVKSLTVNDDGIILCLSHNNDVYMVASDYGGYYISNQPIATDIISLYRHKDIFYLKDREDNIFSVIKPIDSDSTTISKIDSNVDVIGSNHSININRFSKTKRASNTSR